MASLIATADGDFSDGAIWASVDATSLLDAENANTALTTSYVESQAFSPGAITIDGIAVKIATRAASPSGTMSIRLAQGGATVAGTEVTVDVQDIPSGSTTAGKNGWFFVKFAAPVTLLGATPYTVSAKTSSATQVNLYRNATAANWARMLRTTTTGSAPAAGDNWWVLGEWTAASTKTDRTVTYDITASTDFGTPAATGLAVAGISYGGILTVEMAASTAYVQRHSGIFAVWAGGVFNMGTTGTPCPRTSSYQLEFDCAADGDFGLEVIGTWNGQGLSRLDGVDNHYVLLNADAAGGATSLTTDSQLSARNGDTIAIASTTRTPGDAETVALTGDAGATSLACGATANAHSGTSPTQAEVIALDRDVRVRSVSTTAMAYVRIHEEATVDLDWVEFRYLGASTTNKRGVEINTSSGACNINKCSFRDFDNHGIFCTNSSGLNNLTITDCVGSKVGHQSSSHCFVLINEATTGTWTVTGCVVISDNTGQGQSYRLNDLGGTFQNNRASSGGGVGLYLDESAPVSGTISGTVVHSMGQGGINIVNAHGGTISNTTTWRNGGSYGLQFTTIPGLVLDGLTAFGNITVNVLMAASPMVHRVVIRDGVIAGDSTFSTITGLTIAGNAHIDLRLENCTFGVASGIHVAHSTQDILFPASAKVSGELVLDKCTLASATEIANTSNIIGYGAICYQRHEDVALAHRVHYPQLGTISLEASVFNAATPAEKLEPSGAVPNFRLESACKGIAVASGESVTVQVQVRKSGAYAGSAPRLRVKENPSAGIAEATLDTLSVGADTWEQLSGAVGPVDEDCWLEFYVDGDGSAGAVYVDDWAEA